MKYMVVFHLVILLFVAGCGENHISGPRDTHPGLSTPPTPEEDQYLAILKAGVNPLDLAEEEGLALIRYVPDARLMLFSSNQKSRGQLEQIKGLRFLEKNEIANLSDGINMVVGFVEFDWDESQYPAQEVLQCFRLEDTHPHAQGKGVRVGLIDTGVAKSHPHLSGHLEIINDPILGLPYEFDGDLVVPGGEPYPAFGHGSHVAGAILTVAPKATIVPFRALANEGTGTDFEVAVALNSARKARVDVVNMSLRLSTDSDVVGEMIRKLDQDGVILVAAAGNNSPDRHPVYPASDPRTIAVAATGHESSGMCDRIAVFSAMGADVDFAAVGVEVMSSVPGGKPSMPWVKSATGTSVAAAIATGNICLALGETNGVSIAGDPIKALRSTAQPVLNGTVVEGRISAFHAFGLE